MNREWKIKESDPRCVMIPDEFGHLLLFAPTKSDASLIVAAPDLLDALEACVRWMDDPADSAFSDSQLAECRAAIAKARGSK